MLDKLAITALSVGTLAAFSGTNVLAGDGCCASGKASADKATTVSMPMDDYSSRSAKSKDIVDTAMSAGSFKTLTAALKAADLVDALRGDGPFTVFAPTDEAFAALPDGTVEELLKPRNKELLTSILTYHVVPGKVKAKDVMAVNAAKTLNGQQVDFSFDNGVQVDGANVVKTDIMASNGVIHVIDQVIMPTRTDIVDTASEAGVFSTLLTAAKSAGLVETLKGDGPLTVLAPTDDAFAKLPSGTVESLLKPENQDKLASILKYHVIPGRVYAADAISAQTATTVEGSLVRFRFEGGQLMANNANVVQTDIETSNGVVHVIDRVIMPN